ncbi:MAG: GNAT family N-acetyltransferase [Pseudomonadota bacterium]
MARTGCRETAMNVEEVNRVSALAGYREEWQSLVESSPWRDVFQTYEWVTTWLECFWSEQPISFLFVRDGARLVGVAPLVQDDSGALGCPNALALPVNPHVRRLDVICGTTPGLVLEAALAHLRSTRGRLRIALRQSLAGSPVAAKLPNLAGGLGMRFQELETLPSPIVRIETDWDTYLATRSPHTRQELRRKVKKAETQHNLAWSVLERPADASRAIESVLEIERKSWKEDSGTSFTSEAGLEQFYARIATRFAEAGWLRVFLLGIKGSSVPVAHIFGAEYGHEYYAIKTSYDSAFRAASPGLVLFYHAIRDCFERRLTAFDFLGTVARWKSELANDERRHLRVCVFSPLDLQCQWCSLRDQHLRPLLKRLVPGSSSMKLRLERILRT